jgi:hypothetical protein
VQRVRTTTAQSIDGHDAYFGTYTINVRLHKVTHHLEGALVSSDIAKNFNRSFLFPGDQLILFAINESSHGRQTIALTWKKVE